jgi:DNA gyrase subunit B
MHHKVFENEVRNIFTALGLQLVQLKTVKALNIEKLRYHKVVLCVMRMSMVAIFLL